MATHQMHAPVRRGTKLLLPLLLGLGLVAKGQSPAAHGSLAVKVIPQYVVVSGYWVEVEQQQRRHPRQSFTLTPQVYRGPLGNPNPGPSVYYYWPPQPDDERYNEKINGFGLQAQHRFYLKASKTAHPSGFYVSYGPSIQFLQVSYNTLRYELGEQNGLPLYVPGRVKHKSAANRFGATVQVGYQAPLPPGRVFLDLYAGAGVRTSVGSASYEKSRYRSGTSSYGHEGWYFPGGVKLGVTL
ncbi:MAG TPA: hypothetical protein VF598_03385 [Hymenobacter sp.]|jgi:hypothetical protein